MQKTKNDYINECKKLQKENEELVKDAESVLEIISENEDLKKAISTSDKQVQSLNGIHAKLIEKFNTLKNINDGVMKDLKGHSVASLFLKAEILELLDKKEEFARGISQIDDLIKFKRQKLQEV